ncbi:hypothetical protein BJ165DRAFT_1138817 [Panaeolus papilionaceus]|nr:hypothetical protein BJ165DRAFT_1138817 [Panaeolus papilionaceus]
MKSDGLRKRSGPCLSRDERNGTRHTKRAKQQAMLSRLMEMPVDIFNEICQYLHPIDLLNLGRVSRSFHHLVKADEFRPIWRQARAKIVPPGMPECPEDMDEPAYADMIFGTRCHVRLEIYKRLRH